MNFRLANHLHKRGWQVKFATLFDRSNNNNAFLSFDLEFDIVHLSAKGIAEKLALPILLSNLARDIDIIIGGMEFASTNYGYLAAQISRKPFISWTHIAFAQHQYRARLLDRLLSRWIYKRLPYVVFPSEGARASLAQVLDPPEHADWRVIANFIDRPIYNHAKLLDETIFKSR